jgi:hypothetical protein
VDACLHGPSDSRSACPVCGGHVRLIRQDQRFESTAPACCVRRAVYNEGIDTVGIERVIEKADVAKGSLYYIFGGKDQLIEAYLCNRHALWMRTVQADYRGCVS